MTDSQSNRGRKQVFQDYYTSDDYEDVLTKLPAIIEEAKRRAGEVIEPTVHEKNKVMKVIRGFIRERRRKVYGGTAINETIKARNPEDAIYDEYNFSDIEFYSPTPKKDLVDLTNLLYEKGFKFPQGREAQHDETFSVFVNFQLYCDISFVPSRIYGGIKTIEIDGINYVDPHFIFIDQLRIVNAPLTAADFLWEKTFKRMYKLLKNYPLEYFDKQIRIEKPASNITNLITEIKGQFLTDPANQNNCLISGFEAYNFYIRHAQQDRTVEQMARVAHGAKRLPSFLTNVPFLELVSVSYRDTVVNLYKFIRGNVKDPSKVTLREYLPLFQFTGYSVFIDYEGVPVARVFDVTGFCVPNIRTTRGYMYVSFQYILMVMLISKFRAHLDKEREMYFNYGIAVSNLVVARNDFLNKKGIGVINNTVFDEFRISCIGATADFMHTSRLRMRERRLKGRRQFHYSPEEFFAQSQESQDRFDPLKPSFANTSGKEVSPIKSQFKLDSEGNIRANDEEIDEAEEDTVALDQVSDDEGDAETETTDDSESSSE